MRTILDNGLTVVLQENRAARVAALQLWVKVGSADETEAEAGLAHLHEHMLFKGTKRRGPGEVARAVESCGGDINAWTSYDQTVYHLVLASDFFDEGLDILADAVTGSVFDPTELSREIEVVCEEIRRAEDMPSRKVSRELFGSAYRVHPYRRPVIGFEKSVRSFTRDQILSFYERHYTAGNMVFVAVGDFDENKALESVKKAFAHARPGVAAKPATRIAEPRQREARATVLHAPVKEAYLSVGWHIPSLRSKDVAALDLLAVLLGQGDASRLVEEVKREKSLVNEIYASAYTPQDPGLLIVGASLSAGKVPEALKETLAQVERVRAEPFGEAELVRAKRMLETETVFQRETVQGQARKLGFFETVAGGIDEEERYLAQVAAATPEELRAAAEKYLVPENLTIALVAEEKEAATAEALVALTKEVSPREVARGTAAAPYQRMSASAGKKGASAILRETLPGGVTLLVKPERHVPIVSLRAAWMGGLRAETPENNGVNALLSRVIVRGTETRNARQIAEEIDDLAGSFGGSSGRNSYGVRGEFLSADLSRGVKLFSELLLSPKLDEAEVAKERALVLDEIRSKDDSPASTAFSLFSAALYDRHPYRLDASGTEESVAGLTGERLKEYLRAHYRLEGLVLSVAGDVEPGKVRDLLAAELARGPSGRGKQPPVEHDAPLGGPRFTSKRLDRKQAHLVIGFRGSTVRSPERHALSVLSAVLSGQGGRLFLELRDRRSLAYTVTSMLGEGLDPGYFGVYIGTSPEKVEEARRGIRAELERIRDEDVSETELSRAQRHLIGAHEIGLQRLSARAGVLALDECYGLGAEFHLAHAERIREVTVADVRRAARQYIDFDRSVTALVSPDAPSEG